MTTTVNRPAAARAEPVAPLTTVAQKAPDDGGATPRPLRSKTFDDRAGLIGAALSSFALVWLCFEYLLPFDGIVGFVVCWYFAFIGLFAFLTAQSNPLSVVIDRVMATAIQAAAALTLLALASAIWYTFDRGFRPLLHLNFFTHDMAGVGPQDPFTKGGQLHALVGTLIEIGIAVAITLPLGVGAAVFMTEVGGKLAKIVRTIVDAMTALPSIIAGLFIYTVLIVDLRFPKNGFAAAMALSVMMLPIIARASDVVLRVVPGGLREASLALGASRWQTVWRVVLPTARPGLATALILGIARGVGETSPVLLTSGASTFFNDNPISSQPMNSLPLSTYFAVRSGQPRYIERGFATAALLMAIVLILFVTARLLARPRVSNR